MIILIMWARYSAIISVSRSFRAAFRSRSFDIQNLSTATNMHIFAAHSMFLFLINSLYLLSPIEEVLIKSLNIQPRNIFETRMKVTLLSITKEKKRHIQRESRRARSCPRVVHAQLTIVESILVPAPFSLQERRQDAQNSHQECSKAMLSK